MQQQGKQAPAFSGVGNELDRPLDERARRVEILPLERRSPGGREMPARTRCELCGARVVDFELRAQARRLLEVVADDLLLLVELAVRLEPICEALVQLCAGRLRKRVVGGVSDQEMAKTERVVARDLRSVRSHDLLADEREQIRGDVVVTRFPSECGDGAAMEDLPSTEPRSTTARSRSPSVSSRAWRSAWIVGGTSTVPSASRASSAISSMNSGFPSAVARIRARVAGSTSTSSRSDFASASASPTGSGSSSTDVAFSFPPPQPGRTSRSSGRATQRRKIGAFARPVDDVLDQVEERWLRPVQVVEDEDEGTLLGEPLEEGAGRQLRVRR